MVAFQHWMHMLGMLPSLLLLVLRTCQSTAIYSLYSVENPKHCPTVALLKSWRMALLDAGVDIVLQDPNWVFTTCYILLLGIRSFSERLIRFFERSMKPENRATNFSDRLQVSYLLWTQLGLEDNMLYKTTTWMWKWMSCYLGSTVTGC